MERLRNILHRFLSRKKIVSVTPYGNGHINDTWLVKTGKGDTPDYILQRINHRIFTDVAGLTDNILKISNHINRSKENKEGYFELPAMVPSEQGSYFYQDSMGDYWRLYHFIKDSKSYDRIENENLAKESGRAFGLLQALTSDLDASTFVEILPKFHHISSRLATFREAVHLNPVQRVEEVGEEIQFVETRSGEMVRIEKLGDAGLLPLRITHNDTKINNVLFNQEGRAIAVVDLDTLMPGFMLYDFGDAIRTGACTCEEDEQNLSKVGINLSLFSAFSSGFMEAVSGIITRTESENLAFSAKVMTYIIGLRFLTDYIHGDTYYKTRYPGHNLMRARVQFKLLSEMEKNFITMENIISETYQKIR